MLTGFLYIANPPLIDLAYRLSQEVPMPGAYAHILAIHHMRHALHPEGPRDDGLDHVRYLGAQGPDPFFFLGHLPPFRRQDARRSIAIGTRLHQIHPQKSLGPLWKAAQHLEATGPAHRVAVLKAYREGFLSHYLLDRLVHPFVYWMTGQEDRPPALARPLHRLLGETSRGEPFPTRELGWIAELYETAFPGEGAGELFTAAARDMAVVKRLLADPLGVKSWLVSLFATTDFVLRSMLREAKVSLQTARQVLNDRAHPWHHPVSGHTTTHTVHELFLQAVRDYRRLHPALFSEGSDAIPDLSIFGDLTFEGHQTDQTKRWHRGGAHPAGLPGPELPIPPLHLCRDFVFPGSLD